MVRERVVNIRNKVPCATLQQIGDRVGVTRERVRQILNEEGLNTKSYPHSLRPRCIYCGKLLNHYTKAKTHRSYCQKCAREQDKILVTCFECGNLFHKSKKWILFQSKDPRYNGRDFCSRKCLGKHLAKTCGFIAHPENRTHYHSRSDQALKILHMLRLGFTPTYIATYLKINIYSVYNIKELRR